LIRKIYCNISKKILNVEEGLPFPKNKESYLGLNKKFFVPLSLRGIISFCHKDAKGN